MASLGTRPLRLLKWASPTDTGLQRSGWTSQTRWSELSAAVTGSTQDKNTHTGTHLYVWAAPKADRQSGFTCYWGQRWVPGGQEHSWPTSRAVRCLGIRATTFCKHTKRAHYQNKIKKIAPCVNVSSVKKNIWSVYVLLRQTGINRTYNNIK